MFEPVDAVSVPIHTNGSTLNIGGEDDDVDVPPSCAAEAMDSTRLADKRFADTGHVSVRIRRVTTTRAGGVSKPPFDSFNLGDHVGDDPVAVAANRAWLAAAPGSSPTAWCG